MIYSSWYSRIRLICIDQEEDLLQFLSEESDSFRKQVLSKVTNPEKQIILRNKDRSLLKDFLAANPPNPHTENEENYEEFPKPKEMHFPPSFHQMEVDTALFEYLNLLANKTNQENGGIQSIESLVLSADTKGNYDSAKVFPYTSKVTKELRLVEWDVSLPPFSITLEHLAIESQKKRYLKFYPFMAPNLRKLTLQKSYFPNLSDLTYLEEVEIMDTPDLEDSDLPALNRIKRLTISNCPNIKNVSSLQDNEEIIILNCRNIFDCSKSFRNSSKITLKFSSKSYNSREISRVDLSYYKKATYLSLQSPEFMEISMRDELPPNLKAVQLNSVEELKEFSLFSFVQKIEISSCQNLECLLGLGSIPKIRLSNLLRLRSLEGLGHPGNKFVRVENCNAIQDFSPLKYVTSVEIVACRKFHDCNDVDHVYDLSLIDCKMISNVSVLHRVHHLTLIRCKQVRSIEGLENIPNLDIQECDNIRKTGCSILEKDLGTREISDRLTNLPDNLYPLILEHLSYEEKIEWILCNTYLYQRLYKSYRMINLNCNQITGFHENPCYREEILKKISCPSHQLSFIDETRICWRMQIFNLVEPFSRPDLLSYNSTPLFFISVMEAVPESLPKIRDLNLFAGIGGDRLTHPKLNKYLCQGTDSLSLKKLQFSPECSLLELSPTLTKVAIQDCSSNIRLSPLPNLLSLSLTRSTIMNSMSDFSSLEYLSLFEITNVDLEPLKNIKRLQLKDCKSLRNIGSLQTNEEVKLVDCEGVDDFTHSFRETNELVLFFALRLRIALDLSYYQKVKEVVIVGEEDLSLSQPLASGSIPASLKTLVLGSIRNLPGLGMEYGHLHTIQIASCLKFSSVKGLGSVHKLILSDLIALKSLKGLGIGNRIVIIRDCHQIRSFSALKKVEQVTIVNCNQFTKASDVNQVKKLRIVSCMNLKDVIALQNNDKLEIVDCPGVVSSLEKST